MQAINPIENQTAFDLALQELGSAEGVATLLEHNSTLSLDDFLPLSVVRIPQDVVILNAKVKALFLNQKPQSDGSDN